MTPEQALRASVGRQLGWAAGGLILCATAVIAAVAEVRVSASLPRGPILVAGWAAAALAALAARWAGARTWRVQPGPRLLGRSAALAAAGLGLAVPMTCGQALVALAAPPPEHAHLWAFFVVMASAASHLCLAAMSAHRALDLAAGRRAASPIGIYAWTVALGLVPFVFTVALAAITSLPMLWVLHRLGPMIEAERPWARLAAAVPRAVVRR